MSLTVDRDTFINLRRDGAKIETPEGGLAKPPRSEIELLSEISEKLGKLIETQERPDPPPVPINVHPPEVTVKLPEKSKPRKWKFKLSKDDKGRTTEITATAME